MLHAQASSKEALMQEEGLHQAKFSGIKPKVNLHKRIDSTTFDNVRVGSAFKISFPAGKNVMPNYKVGFPLGSEKPFIEATEKDK